MRLAPTGKPKRVSSLAFASNERRVRISRPGAGLPRESRVGRRAAGISGPRSRRDVAGRDGQRHTATMPRPAADLTFLLLIEACILVISPPAGEAFRCSRDRPTSWPGRAHLS